MCPNGDSIPAPNDYPLDAYVNKRAVARRHRATLLGFAATAGCFLLIPVAAIIDVRLGLSGKFLKTTALAFFFPYTYMSVQGFLFKRALGENTFFSLLFAACIALPVVNVIALILVSTEVVSLLRRAGLRIGLVGVSEKEYDRRFSPWLCNWCDYDLTGNRSGVCPECGNKIPASMLGILADRDAMLGMSET